MLSYERMGGRIELTPEHMPYHKDAWRQLSVYTQVRGGREGGREGHGGCESDGQMDCTSTAGGILCSHAAPAVTGCRQKKSKTLDVIMAS
jgi:hypothetical protein